MKGEQAPRRAGVHYVLPLALGLLAAGCDRASSACPPGMVAQTEEGRCVVQSQAEPSKPETEVDLPTRTRPRRNGVADAAVTLPDAEPPDADAQAGTPTDAGATEAGTQPTAPREGDGSALAEACDEAARDRWLDFHLSADVVDAIGACIWSSALCDGPQCTLATCVGEAAGIAGCDACVEGEVTCVAAACTSECGARGDSDRCRACACEHGCVAGFEACSGQELGACDDCSGPTCHNQSLAPELIMVVVNGMLL